MFYKKTGNLIFFSQNWFVKFSECIWIVSNFFIIFEFLFLVLKKTINSHEIWISLDMYGFRY